MAKPVYPLQQIIAVKENRVLEQEKVVAEKRRALEKEQDKLKEAEKACEVVQQHYNAKLAQMRHKMDTGTNTAEIQQMKAYLKVVAERLKSEQKKVKDQEAQVLQAEKNVEEAVEVLKQKRQQVDKFLQHRTDWLKVAHKEAELEEAKEQDEMGSIIFTGKHYRRS